ncbi:MAG: hypothetical protein IPL12_06885 [Bacteroidetes bacterium]|nr:hypothetical protein [Bacteroidota bacterium]MBK8343065.1 hypothetical protein [Bacteroidota bacterium]
MLGEIGKYLDNIIMLLGGCYALYLAKNKQMPKLKWAGIALIIIAILLFVLDLLAE